MTHIHDGWLIKTDVHGILEWNQTYGGWKDDWINSIIQIADGDYVLAGSTSSFGGGGFDAWLIRTDAHGVLQWNKTYGDGLFDDAKSIIPYKRRRICTRRIHNFLHNTLF